MAVHGAFFSLLYLGFSWQVRPPELMSVELWQSLPEAQEAPPALPKAALVVQPPPQPPQPVQPEKVVKPDIALPEKKKPEVKRTEKKPEKKSVDATKAARKAAEQERLEREAEKRLAEQAERERAEQAAARNRVATEYKTKIQNKVTRNIVMPPGVPDEALAVFRVTLLPGGAILSAEMKKSSGNAAYDNAVERAILKSDPLPLPPDPAMFKDFRVLELKFQPRK